MMKIALFLAAIVLAIAPARASLLLNPYALAVSGPANITETFENTPLTGSTLTWSNGFGATQTISRSTANETQGTYSWSYSGIVSGSNIISTAASVNLTGYATVSVDVYCGSLPADSVAALFLSDGTDTATDITSFGCSAAADTLTLNLASYPNVGPTGVTLYLMIQTFATGGFSTVYFDNLVIAP